MLLFFSWPVLATKCFFFAEFLRVPLWVIFGEKCPHVCFPPQLCAEKKNAPYF